LGIGRRLALVEVALLADSIGFGQPSAKLRVHITWGGKPEGVNMIAWRDGLDDAEARVLESPRQDDVAVEPIRSRCDLRKGHAHLESDASLFGKDANRAERADRGDYLVEKRSNLRPLAAEMMLQIVPGAGVRLVAVCEVAIALFALPQRMGVHAKSRPYGLTAAASRLVSG